MTTSSTTTRTTKESDPRKRVANPREERFDKMTDTARRYAFPVFVFIAAFITWLALSSAGLSSGEMAVFTYPSTAAIIIAWFNLAIMVYPAILAVTKHHQRLVRLLIIIGSVVVTFLLLPFVFRLLASWGMAQALWGLVIPGTVAIALHGWAAIMLTRYAVDDTEIQAARDALSGIRRNVGRASEEAAYANQQLKSLRATHDTQTADHDKLENELRQRGNDVTKARKALDKSALVIKRAAVAADLEASNETLEGLEIKLKSVTMSPGQKPAAKTTVSRLRKDVNQAKAKVLVQEQQLERLDDEIASSPEKVALDKAVAENDVVLKRERKHRKLLDGTDENMEAAASEVATKNDKLEALMEQKEEVEARIQEANTGSRSVWRDIVFGPAVALIASLILYSAWYGWVLIEIG